LYLVFIAEATGPTASGLGAVAVAAVLLADPTRASLFADAPVRRAPLPERR
jgi:hypothetical protein